jgi:hypothetical protein
MHKPSATAIVPAGLALLASLAASCRDQGPELASWTLSAFAPGGVRPALPRPVGPRSSGHNPASP